MARMELGVLTDLRNRGIKDVFFVVSARTWRPLYALLRDAARLLTVRGRRAARLVDGMLEWRLTDLPVTTAA